MKELGVLALEGRWLNALLALQAIKITVFTLWQVMTHNLSPELNPAESDDEFEESCKSLSKTSTKSSKKSWKGHKGMLKAKDKELCLSLHNTPFHSPDVRDESDSSEDASGQDSADEEARRILTPLTPYYAHKNLKRSKFERKFQKEDRRIADVVKRKLASLRTESIEEARLNS